MSISVTVFYILKCLSIELSLLHFIDVIAIDIDIDIDI